MPVGLSPATGEAASAALSVIAPVFAFIAIGMLTARLELFESSATDVLNRFVVYLALPALPFDAMPRIQWTDVAHVGFLAALVIPDISALLILSLERTVSRHDESIH
jgi:malonate transporter